MKLPWRKYVVLYEIDLHKTQIARVKNNRAVWNGVFSNIPIYLKENGKWEEDEYLYGYRGTWKAAPKWIPWWKRVKPLELNKRAKKEWQRSLDMNRAPSVGRETIWGVTVTGLLGALGAIILSALVILVLWLLSSLFL